MSEQAKPLLPLTATERQCAIVRAAMHDEPQSGAGAACIWIFRLRGEWSRTPTAQEFAGMLAELRREPEPSIEQQAFEAGQRKLLEWARYRALLERIVDAPLTVEADAELLSAIDDARKELDR